MYMYAEYDRTLNDILDEYNKHLTVLCIRITRNPYEKVIQMVDEQLTIEHNGVTK